MSAAATAARPTPDDFRAGLLRRTLANAAGIPFYRDHWRGHDWEGIAGLRGLAALPLLDKATYRAGLEPCRPVGKGLPRYLSHSTGTTTEPIFRLRTVEEAEVVRSFFSRVALELPAADGPLPITLSFGSGFHGMTMPMPARGLVIPAGLSGDAELRQACLLLHKRFNVEGVEEHVSVMTGAGAEAAALAQALLDLGHEPPVAPLRALALGDFLDEAQRELIEWAFGAPVIERFSLSEALGGASRKPHTGRFHLDIHLLGEVVDSGTLEPIEEGVGELVLTELYPFAQYQPMIRYRTEDVVERVALEPGNLVFDWWGRARDCVGVERHGRWRWLLGHSHVLHGLGRVPEVAREELFHDVTSLSHHAFGLPLYLLEQREEGGRMVVELVPEICFSPWLHRERAAELGRAIREDLLRRAGLPAGDREALDLRIGFTHGTGGAVFRVDRGE